ncbi:MAG: Rrf2 family transcriptional regulator [Nitrospinae bacterium]|nr:Rrf2 family transcriptional regulator [Nitrospinota bacterium]
MRISTKGHYAVQAMVDLAAQSGEAPVSLGVIAERQELSQNYLEQLFVKLRKSSLVKSSRGPGGGYILARPADHITIGQIFDAVDESMVLTECVDGGSAAGPACAKSSACRTQALWAKLGSHFNELVRSITLKDVLEGEYDLPRPSAGHAARAEFVRI